MDFFICFRSCNIQKCSLKHASNAQANYIYIYPAIAKPDYCVRRRQSSLGRPPRDRPATSPAAVWDGCGCGQVFLCDRKFDAGGAAFPKTETPQEKKKTITPAYVQQQHQFCRWQVISRNERTSTLGTFCKMVDCCSIFRSIAWGSVVVSLQHVFLVEHVVRTYRQVGAAAQ